MQPLCDDFFREIEGDRNIPPAAVVKAERAYLAAVNEHLLARHDARVLAWLVNQERSDLIDRLIRKLFRLAEDRFFEDNSRLGSYRLAVVATGGYGRRELAFGSDIDLLFLYRGKINPYVETLTESITQRLWDARLVVGSAVRTIQDCRRVSRGDLPTLTSLMDSRFVIGDPGLFAEIEQSVHDWVHSDPLAFIESKLRESRERHQRYGESAYLLQPNVRESVGGLRDYHTALWCARAVQWEVRRPEHLHLHGFVDEREMDELLRALDFLWRARNQLHRGGRKEDRLHFEAQERLVEGLGFEGTERLLPIEQLMQTYYRHARVVEQVSARVVDHARAIAEERRRWRIRRRPGPRPVEEGFALAAGRLEVPHERFLHERPLRMLTAFAVAQRHDVPLSIRSQRLLRANLALVDDAFRKSPEAADAFRGILCAPDRVYRTLVVMNDVGVLGAFLPEFDKLVGLWQHDLYHTYTVDAHSLFLVEQLRRLSKGSYDQELSLAGKLMQEVADPYVLYLSSILHDIGKGRGGGHSAKGARLIDEIAARLGLDDGEHATVRYLVLHHLTMSAMAERRDVHDARLILNLAEVVRTRARLRNLYLLTVADIRSVSPEAWTTWKGGLLEALYRNTTEWLEAGESDESAPEFFLQRAMERAAAVESEATRMLEGSGLDEQRVHAFLADMPRRYMLSHGGSEVAAHVAAALEFVDSSRRAAVRPFRPQGGERGFTGLVVLAQDRPGLLATSTGVLRASGHDILGAQIYTTRHGLAVQIFEISPIPGGRAEEAVGCARIEQRLEAVLDGSHSLEAMIGARPLPHGVGRDRPPGIRITNDESEFYTIVDVAATDRPGLLHDLTRAVSEAGIDIFMSRASTRARRINDSFYVTEDGEKITDPERQSRLEQALLRAIEGTE